MSGIKGKINLFHFYPEPFFHLQNTFDFCLISFLMNAKTFSQGSIQENRQGGRLHEHLQHQGELIIEGVVIVSPFDQ